MKKVAKINSSASFRGEISRLVDRHWVSFEDSCSLSTSVYEDIRKKKNERKSFEVAESLKFLYKPDHARFIAAGKYRTKQKPPHQGALIADTQNRQT